MELCQSFPCPGLLSPRMLQGKVFLCLSKLSFREARQLRPWLTACPVSSGLQNSAEHCKSCALQKFPERLAKLDSLLSLCLNSGEDWYVQLRAASLCSQVLIFLKRTLRRGECDWGEGFCSVFQLRTERLVLYQLQVTGRQQPRYCCFTEREIFLQWV